MDRYFHCLAGAIDGEMRHGVSPGIFLHLQWWETKAGEKISIPLEAVAEAFVLPMRGLVQIASPRETTTVGEGSLAFLPGAPKDCYSLRLSGCAIAAVFPRRSGAGGEPDASGGVPTVFRFSEVLAPQYEGWKFFSYDGEYLTAGCSYREAPPPAAETPHSHRGEQFNVPIIGRFQMTVGGVTQVVEPGWVVHIPPETLHTGLHLEFPYFQVVFATPPRGKEYGAFLASIYQARETEI